VTQGYYHNLKSEENKNEYLTQMTLRHMSFDTEAMQFLEKNEIILLYSIQGKLDINFEMNNDYYLPMGN